MHARELVELAAVVANQGPLLMHASTALPAAGIEDYLVASKRRLDDWGRSIRAIRTAHLIGCGPRLDATKVSAVVEEILSSEVLTRVWTAVLAGCQRLGNTPAAEIVGRHILQGQLEARHQVLYLLDDAKTLPPHEALSLSRLCRRVDGWSDLLVGQLSVDCDVTEFAPEPARAAQFADDIRQRPFASQTHQAWQLVQVALRAAFRPHRDTPSPHASANSRVAAAILSCLDTDLALATSAIGLPIGNSIGSATGSMTGNTHLNGYVGWPEC
jgi:hypothetical protein